MGSFSAWTCFRNGQSLTSLTERSHGKISFDLLQKTNTSMSEAGYGTCHSQFRLKLNLTCNVKDDDMVHVCAASLQDCLRIAGVFRLIVVITTVSSRSCGDDLRRWDWRLMAGSFSIGGNFDLYLLFCSKRYSHYGSKIKWGVSSIIIVIMPCMLSANNQSLSVIVATIRESILSWAGLQMQILANVLCFWLNLQPLLQQF